MDVLDALGLPLLGECSLKIDRSDDGNEIYSVQIDGHLFKDEVGHPDTTELRRWRRKRSG